MLTLLLPARIKETDWCIYRQLSLNTSLKHRAFLSLPCLESLSLTPHWPFGEICPGAWQDEKIPSSSVGKTSGEGLREKRASIASLWILRKSCFSSGTFFMEFIIIICPCKLVINTDLDIMESIQVDTCCVTLLLADSRVFKLFNNNMVIYSIW